MYRDPVTGDELTRLEYWVRQAQVMVRTPWFIVAFNLITLVVLLHGSPLEWNLFASWLAIIIEWLVGTYMFGQTGRDAVHIRRIARLEEVNEVQLQHLETILEQTRPQPPQGRQGRVRREAPEAP